MKNTESVESELDTLFSLLDGFIEADDFRSQLILQSWTVVNRWSIEKCFSFLLEYGISSIPNHLIPSDDVVDYVVLTKISTIQTILKLYRDRLESRGL